MEEKKTNDSKVHPSDRSSRAKNGNLNFKSDDITVKSIFVSELKSDLSETENDKLSIVESFSEDDESIKSKQNSVPKAKIAKEQLQPKQPKTEGKLAVQFRGGKFGSLDDEESDEDDTKFILGDYTDGTHTHSVSLPDATPTSQKAKTSDTPKLETKATVKDNSSKASASEKFAAVGPKLAKTQTVPIKSTSISKSAAKVATKPKMASPAPFAHSHQAKKVPPAQSPKLSFDRRKAVNATSSPAGKSDRVRRAASPNSPASIREKCVCKLLFPEKINFPIGEKGRFLVCNAIDVL